ncbi:MAG: DPP IV N-terminal domain-containing protein, partial [Planctomycetales bacterium]|nr:DPP IV N-terminal domain-containing protein [Planctomycetales bacterium]
MSGSAFRNCLLAAFICFAYGRCGAALWAQQTPLGELQSLVSVAEQSGFTATATGSEVEAFLRRLASHWPEAEVVSLGRSVEDRPLWALVVEPKMDSGEPPLSVMLLGGIHAGQCAGKESLLRLARELALENESREKDAANWQALRLIFVPNVNADGNERRGVDHRPGQDGPTAGMGVDENAQGLDLDLDFIKLESPEVRSLVRAIDDYGVDILIDTQTRQGATHGYPLTYAMPHNPAAPAASEAWLRDQLLPDVRRRLQADGLATFFAGDFDAEYRRWQATGHLPRNSIEYMGLRGRMGIRAEANASVSYETRIHATQAFVAETLRAVAERAPQVQRLTRAATDGPRGELPLRAEWVEAEEAVTVQGYQRPDGSPPHSTASPQEVEPLREKDYVVSLWNRAVGRRQVRLPAAYVIPEQYAWAVSRLLYQGIEVRRLASPLTATAESYVLQEVQRGEAVQGHKLLAVEVESHRSAVALDRGSYVVETAQPLGAFAAYLLEPESDDGMAAWNFFDPDLVAGEKYPVLRILEELPREVVPLVQQAAPAERLTLSRLLHPERAVDYSDDRPLDVRWLDNDKYAIVRDGRCLIVDAATGGEQPYRELELLRNKLAALDAFDVGQARDAARLETFSKSGRHALLTHRKDLYYFDAANAVARQLTHSPDAEETLAELSPSGEQVAFVRDNNLWVVDCQTTELKQLTEDGSSERLNGILDWVYQEELYGRGNFKGFWWSPDGRQLAYLQLDQTPVLPYRVSDSTSVRQTWEETRYPKAGDPLPTAQLWIVDIDSGRRRQVDLEQFPADDRLLARVSWSPQGELWLQVFNRVQNEQHVLRVDRDSGATATLFTEVSAGWIEVRGTPEFLPDGNFLWLSDLPDGRTHLFHVSVADGKKRQLTRGGWDIGALLAVSPDGQTAFVSGSLNAPTESHLIAVDIAAQQQRPITRKAGTHRVQVSPSGKFFIDSYSSITAPPVTSLRGVEGKVLRVIDAPTSDRYQFLAIEPPQYRTVTARDGVSLQALVMLPAEEATGGDDSLLAASPTPRLPVLFYVYGGPQAPTVKNVWSGRNYWWHQMLCQQGFAVVLCDNRSALGRGVSDTWRIRGDLGRVELQDLEDAAAWVTQQSWADSERLGVWGWSYGGYFTAYAMTHCQLFRAGI